MNKMKMGKVLTFTTKEDASGNTNYVVTPIPAERTPEMQFARTGLLGQIESYEVSAEMPLAFAVTFALQKAKALGITETICFKW